MLLKYLAKLLLTMYFKLIIILFFIKIPSHIDSDNSIRILSRNFHSLDYDNLRKDILKSPLCDKPLFENLALDSAIDLYNNILK